MSRYYPWIWLSWSHWGHNLKVWKVRFLHVIIRGWKKCEVILTIRHYFDEKNANVRIIKDMIRAILHTNPRSINAAKKQQRPFNAFFTFSTREGDIPKLESD